MNKAMPWSPSQNCAPYKISLLGNDLIEILENIEDYNTKETHPTYITAVTDEERIAATWLSPHKQQFITKTVCLTVPEK
jgi:hypothetical protein